MIRRIDVLGFWILASLGTLGCSSKTEIQDSRTSWLTHCTKDSDCSSGLECECGVCTSTCTSSAQCGVEGASCHSASSLSEACGDEDAKLCVQACTSDGDCPSHLSCEQGVCHVDAVSESVEADSGDPSPAQEGLTDGAVAAVSDGGIGAVATSPTGVPSTQLAPNPGVGRADKVDLLFVLDNSSQMQMKQDILAEALPRLVSRLTRPECVTTEGTVVPTLADSEDCPSGAEREFQPVQDINIAVITTSLGDWGADDGTCTPDGTAFKSERNDNANLLGLLEAAGGRLRGVTALDGSPDAASGFLHWNANSEAGGFNTTLGKLVSAAGEFGCGYEATLESWMRFLVDPAPYKALQRVDCGGGPASCVGPVTTSEGVIDVDINLLSQRQSFLRPDSVVAIVMLSDENDCSFKASGQSWRLSTVYNTDSQIVPQYKSTASCETKGANDNCCVSCALDALPTGCSGDMESEGCRDDSGNPTTYPPFDQNGSDGTPSDDQPNLRCFKQKSRFGVDYLYPVQRYINALTQPRICPQRSDLATDESCDYTNPLFDDLTTTDAAAKQPPRDPSRVLLAGIVGVPWQDLAEDADPSAPLVLRTATDPESNGSGLDWDLLLGADRYAPEPVAEDPWLHEQVAPRTGTHPVTGEPMAGVDSAADAQSVNGHEWNIASKADLQYACTFTLRTPVVCPESPPDIDGQQHPSCECTYYGDEAFKNPLCQADGSTTTGLTQYRGKAYPGLRQLQVLHGLGANAVVASICPKTLSGDVNDADYGYAPAVAAIGDALKLRL